MTRINQNDVTTETTSHPDQHEVLDCPECSSSTTYRDREHGEQCCSECGLVLSETVLDRGPEWRAFSAAERRRKSRVGTPQTELLHDKGLTTEISWQDKDGHGKALSPERRRQMHRLRTWNRRSRAATNSERNLRFALSEIDRMACALDVPRSMRKTASVIYRQALDEDLIRGRSIEGIATATLYVACRMEGFPRSLDELTTVSRVERAEIARTYRYIARELSLELAPADPRQYIPRFCSELGLPEAVKNRAIEISVAGAEEGLLSGKSPTGYAAAAIYTAALLANEHLTQRGIAEVANVTEVTIRNHYQEQIDVLEASAPSNVTDAV